MKLNYSLGILHYFDHRRTKMSLFHFCDSKSVFLVKSWSSKSFCEIKTVFLIKKQSREYLIFHYFYQKLGRFFYTFVSYWLLCNKNYLKITLNREFLIYRHAKWPYTVFQDRKCFWILNSYIFLKTRDYHNPWIKNFSAEIFFYKKF